MYLDYGSELLEGNVRSFLSAKGKVNKGIKATIKNYPEMFFAYNNGIAAPKFERIYNMLIEEIKEALPNIKIVIMEPFVLPGTATVSDEEHPGRWETFRTECDLRQQAE